MTDKRDAWEETAHEHEINIRFDVAVLKDTQEKHDDASARIVLLLSCFVDDEAFAVLDLARGRLAMQRAISRRLSLELAHRKQSRTQDALPV